MPAHFWDKATQATLNETFVNLETSQIWFQNLEMFTVTDIGLDRLGLATLLYIGSEQRAFEQINGASFLKSYIDDTTNRNYMKEI